MAQDECLGGLSCSMLGFSFFYESAPVETGGANIQLGCGRRAGLRQVSSSSPAKRKLLQHLFTVNPIPHPLVSHVSSTSCPQGEALGGGVLDWGQVSKGDMGLDDTPGKTNQLLSIQTLFQV